MSNNDHSPMDADARRRMVTDALKDFYAKHDPSPKHPDAALIARAMALNQAIYNMCTSIVQADHNRGGRFHKPSMFETVMKLHLDAFTEGWSKDDLLRVLVIVSTEVMTESLEEYAKDL